MRLSIKEGKIDEEKAKSQILYLIDRGVNSIDTAWTYHLGENEPLLGRILARGYRKKVKLATKLPSWSIEKNDDMDRILDSQLERLRTNHIDYYLVHSLVGVLWDKLEKIDILGFLDRARVDGRIVTQVFFPRLN